MVTEDNILKMIRYASKAPSGHNTQPWKFSFTENSVTIHPDLKRSLPVVDADNHALYISLGCALENLILAAGHFNCETKVSILKKTGEAIIKVDLLENAEVQKSDLFYSINKRQVTKGKYNVRKLSENELNELLRTSNEQGVKIKFFSEKHEIQELTPFIIEGSNQQFKNKAFVNELVSWIRFGKNEAAKTGDGIWSATMGMPNCGRWIGEFVMKKLVSASSEAKRWVKLIDCSAGFALFMVEKNEVEHWIKLGQSFQRFGLEATKLNIKHAHVNMPCEVETVRQQMIKHFKLHDLTPLLLIRFGYSNPFPYSFRRNLNQIIIN